MPQPKLTKDIFFGNAALPNGQGTMGWVNLNDGKWRLRNYHVEGTNRQIALAQYPGLSAGAYISDDYFGKSVVVPVQYLESSPGDFGAAKALLTQAGEQWLTTDNKVTAAPAKLRGLGTPKIVRSNLAYLFETELSFLLGREPYFRDLTVTNITAFAVNGSSGAGTTNNFNVTYNGSVWCKDVLWQLHVPATNTQAITQVVLQNTMSGEVLTWNGTIPASQAHDLWIDTSAMTVKLDSTQQDFTGSFPRLYPPAGQVNSYSIKIVANGATTGVTLAAAYYNRWEL